MTPLRALRGFTLVELLIVMGVLGILTSVAVVAINPQRQLCSAQNARRTSYENAFDKALQQYSIRETSFAGGDQVPEGEDNALPICRIGITDPSCITLDVLIPDYLIELPVDDAETNPLHTGYAIYKTTLGRQYVIAQHVDTSCVDASTTQQSANSSAASSSVSSSSSASSVASSSAAASSSSAGGTDVTSQVLIAKGGPVFNRFTSQWTQAVTVTNTSGASIPGGFRFDLQSSTTTLIDARISATVLTIDSSVAQNPRVQIPSAVVAAMAPGASFTLNFVFTGASVSYTNQLVSTGF